MSKVPTEDRKIVDAVSAPLSDSVWVDIGKERLKAHVPLFNDLFTKLVVLNTALAGTFLGLKDVPLSPAARAIAVACFILSLVCSFFGLFPKKDVFNFNYPPGIQAADERAVAHKGWFLKLAAAFLVAGLFLAALGLVVGGFSAEPSLNPTTSK